MTILAIILLVAGGILSLVYSFVLLIKAFQASILWGLAYIFVPFASLVFIILHWDETSNAFWKTLLGAVLMFAGMFLSMAGAAGAAG